MYQHLSSTPSKRVPGQHHLTLHTQPTYRGLPVLNCARGFVSEYLDRLYCTIHRAMQSYSRIFAVRVDLHFPQNYFPGGQEVLSTEYLHLFIKVLRRWRKQYKNEKQQLGRRVHDAGSEYVWAREYGPSHHKPHFHLLLLFNGNAFKSLGHFSSAHESLYNRIGESWAEALGLPIAGGVKFVYFPSDGQYLLDSRNQDRLAQVFCRASYLAKAASKKFDDRC